MKKKIITRSASCLFDEKLHKVVKGAFYNYYTSTRSRYDSFRLLVKKVIIKNNADKNS